MPAGRTSRRGQHGAAGSRAIALTHGGVRRVDSRFPSFPSDSGRKTNTKHIAVDVGGDDKRGDWKRMNKKKKNRSNDTGERTTQRGKKGLISDIKKKKKNSKRTATKNIGDGARPLIA